MIAQELSQRSGQLVQVPNLKATWLLDEVWKERERETFGDAICESVMIFARRPCSHVATMLARLSVTAGCIGQRLVPVEATESWVDEKRLAERFGPRPSDRPTSNS